MTSAPTEDLHEEARFGFRTVPLTGKQALVDDVFHKVARRYDLMNDLMSGGLHRVWKDILAAKARPSRSRPFAHLDVAGGTGDVAFRVLASAGALARSTVLDVNGKMLAVGRRRARSRGLQSSLSFIEGNAEDLPLRSDSFDVYTIAFGIRNVPRIARALTEAHRVLRRGGRFLCLEFSQVDVPFFDRIYEAYSFSVIPRLGQWVAGDGEPYRYLVESIREFPDRERFRAMIEEAGFQRCSATPLTGGVVAVHSGWKL